jgi:hypothetical protein
MKQVLFHFIYLSIIAFLGFNYWSSVQAFKAFEHINQQLKMNNKVVNNAIEFTNKSIGKQCHQYPSVSNLVIFNKSQKATESMDKLVHFIKKNQNELNFDTINSFNYSQNSPKNSFFNDGKIAEMKNELIQYSNELSYLISNEKDKKSIDNQLCTMKIATNKPYWEALKYLPLNGALMQLSFLENQVKLDAITMLNYLFYEQIQTWGESIEFNAYKTAIAPNKGVLIEGETFEADIYIAKYASNFNNNAVIKVNGEILETKDGVAHFKSKKQTIGIKQITAESVIKNPFTGNIITVNGSFEYQVLPKCSRDCQ